MQVFTGIGHVRRHPERFLRSLPATGAELAEKLAGDLLLLGGSRILLLRVSDWFGIASDHPWLPDDATQLKRVFEDMRPFPEAGVNSVHSEILIGAFASDVTIVASPDEPILLIGASPAPADALPAWVAQAVWFRVGDSDA